MVLWRQRPLGYQIGFYGLLVGNLTYVIAFALPQWSVLHLQKYGLVDQTVGLWQACIAASSTCVSNVHRNNPAWLNAVRVTCSMALLFFALSVWIGCYRNFSKAGQQQYNSPGSHVEGLSVMGCLLGFTGSFVFAFQFQEQYVQREDIGSLHWGYVVLIVSLGLSTVSAGLMFCFNRRCFHERRQPARLRLRGPNGSTVAVELFGGSGDEVFHIPYFGEVSRSQLAEGAIPIQPPSYELATAGVGGYGGPPGDAADAPPVYEDVAKDGLLPSRVQDGLQGEVKAEEVSESQRGPGTEEVGDESQNVA